MNIKGIIKNSAISAIVGIILGAISECALIFNITLPKQITQSYIFWFVIIAVIAIISKDYKLTLINPMITISLMNITYYITRLSVSGYTDYEGLVLYSLTGIAGAIYIGTLVYIVKTIVINLKKPEISKIIYLISMTIFGAASIALGLKIIINNNILFNIDLGIITGFVLAVITLRLYKLKQ